MFTEATDVATAVNVAASIATSGAASLKASVRTVCNASAEVRSRPVAEDAAFLTSAATL